MRSFRVGRNPIGLVSLYKKKRHQGSLSLCTYTEERPPEDIVEKAAVRKPGREASPETNADGTLILNL